MTLQSVMSVLSSVLCLAAFIPYLLALAKGTDRPIRTTWILWAVVQLLIIGDLFTRHQVHRIFLPLAFAVGDLLILVIAIRKGEGGWRKKDILCFVGALLAAIPWLFFRANLVGLLLLIFINFIGATHMFQRGWTRPQDNDRLTWAIWLLSGLAAVLGVRSGDPLEWVYPWYVFLGNLVMNAFINIRPYFVAKDADQ